MSRTLSRPGKALDHSKDPDILRAALELFAEVGYERASMDAIAARAGTTKASCYRRWTTKEALAAAAIRHLGSLSPAPALPNTGTFRSDLVAMIGSSNFVRNKFQVEVVSGLIKAARKVPSVRAEILGSLLQPQAAALLDLFRKAQEKGDIAVDADPELWAQIGPAMVAYRILILDEPVDQDFIEHTIIDRILMPLVDNFGAR